MVALLVLALALALALVQQEQGQEQEQAAVLPRLSFSEMAFVVMASPRLLGLPK